MDHRGRRQEGRDRKMMASNYGRGLTMNSRHKVKFAEVAES